MATNVSYASNDSILESLVLHTVPDFGPHGDGIINTNFLFSALKAKDKKEGSSKRFQVIDGGLEFWNGVLKQESSNFKWQAATADMTAQLQDPSARLRWEPKVFTGSLVINELHKAQNKGKAMMKEFARTLREQAESTIPNQFNSAFWAASPATTEPESIPSLISATPTSGTIGGATRSTAAYLQNGAYTTAVADIGSEAGIAAMTRQIIRYGIGSGGQDCPDLGIMGDDLFAGLSGYLSTLNRYRPDDTMAQLGFDTIKIGKTALSYENTNVTGNANSITSGYIYLINSNYIKFKVLADGNFKWASEFERVGQTLNKALYFMVFCNLTTNLPKAHVVMTNVSTA
jgi:hypothetical protein